MHLVFALVLLVSLTMVIINVPFISKKIEDTQKTIDGERGKI